MTAIGPGSRVRCIADGDWLLDGTVVDGPVLGEICTVSDIEYGLDCTSFLALEEWRPATDVWSAHHFRPLDGIDDLVERFRTVSNPDAPAGVPPPRIPEYVTVRR